MPYADPKVAQRYACEYQRKWRAANPKRAKAINKRSYYKHRATRNEISRQWRLKNPLKVKIDFAKYYKANLEVLKKNFRQWQAENRSKRTEYEMRRQARKRAVTVGDLTDIAKVYDRAKWWRQWFDVAVDHIIPLARNGTHEASNLQIIYKHENLAKRARPDYKPKVVFV